MSRAADEVARERVATTVLQAVALAVDISTEEVKLLVGDGGRFSWDGLLLGYNDPVPPTPVPALVRTGRHLWLIDWQSETDYEAIRLTE